MVVESLDTQVKEVMLYYMHNFRFLRGEMMQMMFFSFFKNKFIYFIFGCVESSLLRTGFL